MYMIPKTEIRYSWIYNKNFDKDFTKKDLINLKKKSKEFEQIYKKNIKILLREIKKQTGEWKREDIPIYIVEKAHYSFSDPLTLKYKENEKLMFIILAHELLHNNLKKKFKNPKELHIYMEPILNKIIIKIDKSLKHYLEKFNILTRSRHNFAD